MSKATLKIDPEVYQEFLELKVSLRDCKYNSDTLAMLVKFYKEHNNG
jgi:hypothetical protein